MSIHVSYNQPDNEIHSYDGKPSAVVTGAGPAIIEIHMTAGEWDAANRLYYRQEATGVEGFVQASESNNQQFLLPCAYLASGELQIALNNPEQGLTTNLMKISITKMSSSGDLSDDDPQFTIDGKKRLVLVPGSQGILAVQFDNESESVTFKFPRYQDGVDLSTKTPYINYRLPSSGELGKSLCSIDTDMLTAEYIYFSWTIDINVTMFEGSIKFQVEFSDSQGYRWQSQIAELPILTSLYNTGLEPYSPSFLEEALRQMQQYSSDAEAFAVGTRNGVPVAEGDPAYHKSALYLSNWFFERSVRPAAKEALLFLLEHAAYKDINGRQYVQNLRDELYDTAEVTGIAATFVQDGVVYAFDSLDSLKPMLTVLATYSDLSVREITAYTLSGTLTVGTSTITVSYGGKTTTFDVNVTFSDHVLFRLENYVSDRTKTGVDTGIAMQSTDRDFCITFDGIQGAIPANSQVRILSCASVESNWAGIYFGAGQTGYLTIEYMSGAGARAEFSVPRSYTGRIRFVYSHVAGSGEVKFYMRLGTSTVQKATLSGTFAASNRNLFIAGASATSVDYSWVGTVTECKVYEIPFTETMANDFLS